MGRQRRKLMQWEIEERDRRFDVGRQQRQRATRAKLGPAMKHPTMVVRDLATGEVKQTIPPTSNAQRREIGKWRRAFRIKTKNVPPMSDKAERLLRTYRARGAKLGVKIRR